MTDSIQEQAPILEVAQAVTDTVANPFSLPVLAEDLLLAHQLAVDVRAKLAGKHPSLALIFQTLFNLG